MKKKMPEILTPAIIRIVDYVCDTCGKGLMNAIGAPSLMSNPPQILHQCNICKIQRYFTLHYPHPRFLKIVEKKNEEISH